MKLNRFATLLSLLYSFMAVSAGASSIQYTVTDGNTSYGTITDPSQGASLHINDWPFAGSTGFYAIPQTGQQDNIKPFATDFTLEILYNRQPDISPGQGVEGIDINFHVTGSVGYVPRATHGHQLLGYFTANATSVTTACAFDPVQHI